MKIGIIGCDIIGLSFALLCEEQGHEVLITDENEDFIFNLKGREEAKSPAEAKKNLKDYQEIFNEEKEKARTGRAFSG